ncbi:hypothetical protein [Candidatus Ruminimicrobium bovinum]|uniref:hypothetical protein n=1 Tax=Candidatus Ruminimicrobium bovinum TaxID=3242779 RepID=UPI0039B9CDAA
MKKKDYHIYPVQITRESVYRYMNEHPVTLDVMKCMQYLCGRLNGLSRIYENDLTEETGDAETAETVGTVVSTLMGTDRDIFWNNTDAWLRATQYLSDLLSAVSKDWCDAVFVSGSHYHEFEQVVRFITDYFTESPTGETECGE